MTKRYWVIGGEYQDPDFRALIPGTETMAGPFEDERRARTEWTGSPAAPSAAPTQRCATRSPPRRCTDQRLSILN
jgi:hypothetical protein